MNNCMSFDNDFCCVMILVFDQCKTNYLLIRALCYSTQQNMKKVLLEYESWIGRYRRHQCQQISPYSADN